MDIDFIFWKKILDNFSKKHHLKTPFTDLPPLKIIYNSIIDNYLLVNHNYTQVNKKQLINKLFEESIIFDILDIIQTNRNKYDLKIMTFLDEYKLLSRNEIIDWISLNGSLLLKDFPDIIKKHHLNIEPSLLELFGDFVSIDILLEVEEFITQHHTYIMHTVKHKIILQYYSKNTPNPDLLQRIFQRIALMLLFTKKKGTLKISIWDCELSKKFPSDSTNKILGVREVNSGCTKFNIFSEHLGEIYIWRREEVEKVLVHELIHALGLDFFMYPEKFNTTMKQQFNLPKSIEIRLGEAYVETWANLINTVLVSYLSKQKKDFKLFMSNLYYEFKFSLLQCTKILKFYGFQCFQDCKHAVYSRDTTDFFKQKSSIFSYYLVKTMIFFNLNSFLKYCGLYNDNILCFQQKNFPEFYTLINQSINNIKFSSLMDTIISQKLEINCSILENSLRMTLLELF